MAQNSELRHKSRADLIEIIYALQQEQIALQQRADALQAQLDDRTLRMENAGSIAQAALSLNDVFAHAQAAADDYLQSSRDATQHQCDEMVVQAKAQADAQWDEFRAKVKELAQSSPELSEKLKLNRQA